MSIMALGLQSEKIVHLPWGSLGNWVDKLIELNDCIAVVHADEFIQFHDKSKIIHILDTNNVKLAVENVRRNKPERIGYSIDEIWNAIKGLPPNLVGICYDTAHGRISNQDIFDLEPYVDRLFLMHFADSRGTKCNQPIGTGDVDFNRVFAFLAKNVWRNFPIIYEKSK